MWANFARSHKMEEYRHGHGLLRGCFREDVDERVALNERSSGMDVRITYRQKSMRQFLWSDAKFLDWCRRSPQVAASEAAFVAAKKLGLVQDEMDELRLRPHTAKDVPLDDESIDMSRFRWLAGVRKIREVCDPAALVELPLMVLIEGDSSGIRMLFPLAKDPAEVLAAADKAFGPNSASRQGSL